MACSRLLDTRWFAGDFRGNKGLLTSLAASPKHHSGESELVGSDTHEIVPVRDEKRPKLSIDVPTRNMGLSSMNYLKANVPLTPGSDSNRINIVPICSPASAKMHASPCSTSSKGNPFIKKLLSGLSFKFQPSASEVERYESQAPEACSTGKGVKPSLLNSFSFSKLFSPRIRRTSSLPINSDLHGKSPHGSSLELHLLCQRKEVQHHISRSLSLPTDIKHIKSKSIKRMNSVGGVFRVIPSTPRVVDLSSPVADSITPVDSAIDGDGEDIPEEEAVCRICMTELSEGSNTLKLECSCKGELALAHQECAVKWFSIRGNRNCEVCGQEVENLSVTLLRVQSVLMATTLPGTSRQRTVYFYRFQRYLAKAPICDHRQNWSIPTSLYKRLSCATHTTGSFARLPKWPFPLLGLGFSHEMPVLIIVSMLAYFCFLEQLLVADVGTSALAISVPFSCILGVFASLTASTMASYASHYIDRPRNVCWIWCCDERKYDRHRVVAVACCVGWQFQSSRDCAIVEPTAGIMIPTSLPTSASSRWSEVMAIINLWSGRSQDRSLVAVPNGHPSKL
ncbi:zinc finger protein [Musa troglodytarum]|uniref:Zinc finger protein n=1 Tax=Musa troglodytarum TaxID=320322 RepID=A0A9E7EK31_9LILI|nr:zinc finger protein [Musa troglodytarum]